MIFKTFQGIALFLNNADYYDLIIIGVTVGLIFAMLSSFIAGKNSPMELVKYVLAGTLLFNILLVPKSTVTIIDKSYISQSSAPMTIGDIPTALAFLMHLSTFTGEWFDKTYTAVYSMPDKMQAAGTHMTRKILVSTVMAEPQNALFYQNFSEYARECLVYDINTGYKSLDEIMNASDTWVAMGDTNNAILVTMGIANAGGGIDLQVMTCGQAYTHLTTIKESIANELESRLAGSMFKGMDDAAAKVAYGELLTQSMAAFMGDATRTTSEHFQNITAQNVFLRSIGEISGDPLSTSRAIIGVDAGSDQKAELAKSFIYTITIIQLLVIAFFPIVAALIIVAGPSGLQPLLILVKVLFWLALIQASQVILDNMILMNSAGESVKNATMYGTGSIKAWDSVGGIINGMEDQLQNALFASLALTWVLMSMSKGIGSGIASGLFSGAQTYNERTATDTAAEGRNNFGDVKWNNSQFGNTSGAQYNTTPSVSAMGAGYRTTDGGMERISAEGKTSYHGGDREHNVSSFDTSTMKDVSTGYRAQSESSKASAMEYSKQAQQSRELAMSALYSAMTNTNVGDAYQHVTGSQNSKQFEDTFSKAKQVASDLSEKYGISESDVLSGITSSYRNAEAGGQVGFSVAGTGANLSTKVGTDEEIQNQFKTDYQKAVEELIKQTDTEGRQAVAKFADSAIENHQNATNIGMDETTARGFSEQAKNASSYSEAASAKLNESERFAELSERAERVSNNMGIDVKQSMTSAEVRAITGHIQGGDYEKAIPLMEAAIARTEVSGGFGPTKQVSTDTQSHYSASGAEVDGRFKDNQQGVDRPTYVSPDVANQQSQVEGKLQDGQAVTQMHRDSASDKAEARAGEINPDTPGVNVKETVSNQHEGDGRYKDLQRTEAERQGMPEAQKADNSIPSAEQQNRNFEDSKEMMVTNYMQAGMSREEAEKQTNETLDGITPANSPTRK